MSSFFPTQLLPPSTIPRRGLCQLQVLLAADRHQSSPLMPPVKTPFFYKTEFVRSLLISALIAIGYYYQKYTKQLNTIAILTFAV
ncbi:hypothetical protein QUB37_12610 [Microcoleus sp. AT3-A2]